MPDQPLTKKYYTTGEVAALLGVNSSLILHWEAEFTALRPQRNQRNQRRYTATDVALLRQIYHLVKERGLTLRGAKEHLKTANREATQRAEHRHTLQRARALLLTIRQNLPDA